MEIKNVLVKDIKYAPYNPRKISDEVLSKLKRSIEEFGYIEPIVVNKRTMHVVGGNQRLKVLRQLDIKEVQAVIVDLDDTHEKALNIALNKISGEWDLPLLKDLLLEIDTGEIDTEITGFNMEEIEELMNQFYVEELDEMPTLPDGDRENFQQMTFTLHDGQVELIQEALRLSKSLGPFESLNENSNGNALARICEIFITNHGNS
jgi:ParB-like chromosome segregation protein Spo0J